MVFDEDRVYGYARKPEFMVNASVLEYELYAADREVTPESIARVTGSNKEIDGQSKNKNANSSDWQLRHSFPSEKLWAADLRWSQEGLPLLAQAMVLAGRTLFVAGPQDVVDEEYAFDKPDEPAVRAALAEQDVILENRKGALLLAVSAADGQKVAEYALDSIPVWDGMAAANGRLYLSLKSGQVLCMTGTSAVAANR
jgi:hypothetical protein